MKNIFRLSAICMAFLMLFSISGCKKNFLGQIPDDALEIDDVFERQVYTERFLANVYSTIRSEVDHNTENTPWEGLSDEMDVTYVNYPMYAMNLGNWDRNRTTYNYWDYYYKGIRNASYFLQNAVEGRNKEIAPELLKQYRAEARFLRAYFYFMLLRQYGPLVILPEEPLAPDASIDEFSLARSSYDECVNYISSEIDKSLPDLMSPNSSDVNNFNRMNKGIALALKSRLLLYAASPLYNGNTDYASFTNKDGKVLIAQQYDAGKWKKAADAAKALIDLNAYSLYKEYNSNGTINPYTSLKNVFLKDWNSEVIMVRPTDMYSADKNGSPYTVGGWSSWGPTQSSVDSYFMANGRVPITGYNTDGSPIINPASGYTETGTATAETSNYGAGASNMYVNREPRFYVAITFNLSKWINAAKGSQANPLIIQMYNGGNSGKYNGSNWSTTGYVTRKLVHPGSTVSPEVIVKRYEIKIRLAEVYLNYVEALNEVDPANSDILKYLNLIRERAGIPQYGQGPGALPIPSDMRTAIRQERRNELAFENFRYFDTRRWKIAEQVEAGNFYGMDVNATTSSGFQKRTVFETRVFQKKYYLWNIIQTELNKDKNLVGNPFW